MGDAFWFAVLLFCVGWLVGVKWLQRKQSREECEYFMRTGEWPTWRELSEFRRDQNG